MGLDENRRKFESAQRNQARLDALESANLLYKIDSFLRALDEAATPFSLVELETLEELAVRSARSGNRLWEFIDQTLRRQLVPAPRSEWSAAKMRNRCKGLNSRGLACHAPALKGGAFCRAHQEQARQNSVAEVSALVADLAKNLGGEPTA